MTENTTFNPFEATGGRTDPTETEANSSYWDSLLARDGWQVAPHLLTPEGRFHAFLNLANVTTKSFIVFGLSETYQSTWEVSLRKSQVSGVKESYTGTKFALEQTISKIGAAAKSDIDDAYWARTPYGTAAIPALVYFAMVAEELDLNPQRALGSHSIVRVDSEGNLVTTPAQERVTALRRVALGEATQIVELKPNMNIKVHNIAGHLKPLQDEGLIEFESADHVKPITYYKVASLGSATKDWGSYAKYSKAGKEFKYTKASKAVADALVCMAVDGMMEVAGADVSKFLYEQWGLTIDLRDLSCIMKFFSEKGFLTRSKFYDGKGSDIEITEKGVRLSEALEEIATYFVDPLMVPKIDAIRHGLNITLDGNHPAQMWQAIEVKMPGLLKAMSERYFSTRRNCYTNDDKAKVLLETIRNNNGELALTEVAKLSQIDQRTARNILDPFMKSGQVIATMRLRENGKQFGKKQYLSIPDD